MRKWHVVGDSHINAIRDAAAKGWLNSACTTTMVAGATAVGLRNPNNSKTNAIEIFKTSLLPYNQEIRPMIHLGEVDCGFVIWYRAQKYGETIQEQMNASIASYFDFLDTLIAAGYSDPVVTGASIPTIRDDTTWGEVRQARREVKATLLERTNLTLLYNSRLRDGANARDICFIDISTQVLDPMTGVIRDEFRNSDPNDHHLDPTKTGALWASVINKISM